METVSWVQLVLRLTWVKHAVGMCMEFMTFMAAGRWNFERVFFWRLLLEVNRRRRLCYSYEYSGVRRSIMKGPLMRNRQKKKKLFKCCFIVLNLPELRYSQTTPYGHLSNTDSSLGPGKMPIHSL